jgi:hypothetical protein
MEITKVKLPLSRTTPGTVLYALPKGSKESVQNVYIRKDSFPNGAYPREVTVVITTDE